ncbi:MAG: hypothetical protein V1770_04570, partial [bacterium]
MFFLALLIAYLIIFTILSWKKPRWAVFVILAALQSYAVRFSIAGIPMTLLEGMIIALFIAWGMGKLNLSRTRRRGRESDSLKESDSNLARPIFLFLLAATISVFVSSDKRAAIGIWKAYFIEPILFLIVFIDLFRRDEALPRLYNDKNLFHFTA